MAGERVLVQGARRPLRMRRGRRLQGALPRAAVDHFMDDLVLIVDDSEEMADVIAFMFARAGVRTLTARSLADVQALADRLPEVTLAILDVNLGPDEPSGVDIDEWMTTHGFTPRVVYLTGHPRNHPLVKQAANHSILIKPVQSKDLLELVGHA